MKSQTMKHLHPFPAQLTPLSLNAAETPNIIVIMAGGLDYGDLFCYGAKAVKTPAIDRLAGEGVRFTSAFRKPATPRPQWANRASVLSAAREMPAGKILRREVSANTMFPLAIPGVDTAPH